jgi:hypothetical protein
VFNDGMEFGSNKYGQMTRSLKSTAEVVEANRDKSPSHKLFS